MRPMQSIALLVLVFPFIQGLPRFAALAENCYFKMPTSRLSSVDININKNSLLTFLNAEHT